jgi:TPR repeat protein
MPHKLFACMSSLPPATRFSVPAYDFTIANEEVGKDITEQYYTCCGKSICAGCIHSFRLSGNIGKCPFCKAQISNKTDKEEVAQVMKRAEANDASLMMFLAYRYYYGRGLQQDREKATELFARAAKLGSSQAHFQLGNI